MQLFCWWFYSLRLSVYCNRNLHNMNNRGCTKTYCIIKLCYDTDFSFFLIFNIARTCLCSCLCLHIHGCACLFVGSWNKFQKIIIANMLYKISQWIIYAVNRITSVLNGNQTKAYNTFLNLNSLNLNFRINLKLPIVYLKQHNKNTQKTTENAGLHVYLHNHSA